MQKIRKLFSLLLVLLMLMAILPVSTEAAALETVSFTIAYTNPLYANLVSPKVSAPTLKAARSAAPLRSVSYNSAEYIIDIDEAAAILRSGMVARKPSITIKYCAPATSDPNTLIYDILDRAKSHAGVPYEGDYLRWQYGGFVMSCSYITDKGNYYLTITYALEGDVPVRDENDNIVKDESGNNVMQHCRYEYYTTAAQEEAVTAADASALASLLS